MSNNFPTLSHGIFLKILSIVAYIVLSIKSLGIDAIHFRIRLSLGYVLQAFWADFFV